MSRSEWLRLTPAQMNPYIEAWAAKQRREHRKLEIIDDIGAGIKWATIAPHQPSGKRSSPEDWRVLVRENDTETKTPAEASEEKEQRLIEQARLAHAAAKRIKQRQEKKTPKRRK